MKTRLTLATITLVLAPSLVFAACGGHAAKQESASACPAGQIWNTESGTCVKITS